MKFRMSPIAAAVLAIYALPVSAQQPETAAPAATVPSPEAATRLKEVKVVDETPNTYKAEAVSSPKFTEPLVNTPQTITVIKKEIIAEQGALSLSDALRNTPGITFQAGENGNTQSGDSIFLRGFDTQGAIFLDNVRDLGAAVRDVFNIEQIEIVKGPAGADNGRGAASGYVNLVSKTPFAENARSGTLSYGDEERRRITADLNQKIGEHSAVRLNLLGQDGGVAGRDEIERRQWGVAPSVAFGLGTDTRITLFSQHIRQDNTPDGGVSAIGISGYRNAVLDPAGIKAKPVDTENYYGLKADFEDITANMFTAKIEHDLKPGVTIRNLSRYGKTEQERILSAPLQAPTVSDGTGATLVVRPDPDSWAQNRNRQASFRDNEILTNQTNLTADFKTGALQHTISSGVEFIYESQYTPTYAVEVTTPAQVQTPANLYNPSSSDPAVTLAPNGVFVDGHVTTGAVYVFDTVKLGNSWQFNGGFRWERYETVTDSSHLAVAADAPIPVGTVLANPRLTDADNLLSWKVGALFKPAENGSVYLAYANSKRPPGTDGFALSTTSTNINSGGLDPQEATNLELGTKWDLLASKLAATAAVFHSENKNDLARAADDSVTQYGKKEVKGVEIGLVGQITSAWQLSFGYTFQDTEVSEGAIIVNPDGSQTSTQTGAIINFSPKNSATLWTTYKLQPVPLTIGGGLRYIDSQARTVNNNLSSITTGIVEVEEYTVFDAVASYEVTKNLGVQLNAYNITDEDYVASVNNSGQRYFPGTPRSYLLTLNLKF